MENIIKKKQSQRLQGLFALGVMGIGTVGQLGVTTVASADVQSVGAGDFDLTKQASKATFPVMFDRPSGVNAAALAGTVLNLSDTSKLKASALKAVPELSDRSKVGKLLGDAMGTDAAKSQTARQTILKLINWYNGLGLPNKITTQSGQAYTLTNLDEPISTLAVVIYEKGSAINSQVVATVDNALKQARTTGDVMRILDGYKAGISNGYKQAFDAYAAKVYAPGANITALSEYAQVKPVLDNYEKMYSDGASAIRQRLLEGSGVSAKEAGVSFFESALITGTIDNQDGGNTSSNQPSPQPAQKNVTTKWVDENGNPLKPDMTGKSYGDADVFPGYTKTSERIENGVKIYTYTKDRTPDVPTTPTTPTTPVEPAKPSKIVTKVTVWVDETGAPIPNFPEKNGEFPDIDGVSDVPGYNIISSKTVRDKDGNVKVTNTYKKIPETPQVNKTYWLDAKTGQQIPNFPAKEGAFPDTDGVSDVPNMEVIRAYTVTQADLDGPLRGTSFKVGDVINIYGPIKEKPTTPKLVTKWVTETGEGVIGKDGQPIPQKEGAFPDTEGDDAPNYTLVRIDTDGNGNVTNVYKPILTKWVDKKGQPVPNKDGQPIQPKPGSHPDLEGDDVPGHRLVETNKDKDGNVTNVYEKNPPVTKWVDKEGNPVPDKDGKPMQPKEGEFPDLEGDDVPGYTLVETNKDKDGNVTNVYEKKAIVTKWVDKQGNPVPDKDGKPMQPKDGSHPDLEGDDVPGYRLIETNKDKDGNVTNVYEKNVVTKWVDEQGNPVPDKDGKPMQPKDGSHPDLEGDDVPGYTLISTTKDKDGNVVNTYKKAAVKEGKFITSWVTIEGDKLVHLKDDVTGDKFEPEAKFDGYELSTTRISQDGKQKYYVYTKKATPAVTKTTPKSPSTPAKATPSVQASLPKMGDTENKAVLGASMGIVGLLGFLGLRKKREQ